MGKIIRTTWESRGEVEREVTVRRRVFSLEGSMVDTIDYISWEEETDTPRELKTLMIHKPGGNSKS